MAHIITLCNGHIVDLDTIRKNFNHVSSRPGKPADTVGGQLVVDVVKDGTQTLMAARVSKGTTPEEVESAKALLSQLLDEELVAIYAKYGKPSIESIILATVKGTGSATWSEICEAVKARHDVKNWLSEVRGPLQGLLNQGAISRFPDVHKEVYVLVDEADTSSAQASKLPKPSCDNITIARAVVRAGGDALNVIAAYAKEHNLSARRVDGIIAKLQTL